MTLSYKYKIIDGRPVSEETKTPLIPITIKGDIAIDTMGIPDSGADITAMPLSLAKAIGLDLSAKKDKCVGIGGWVNSIPSRMHISFGKSRETYSFWMPVKVILDKI